MRIFEVVYASGEKHIVFAKCRADAFAKHPIAWLVYEVSIY
jgi:hypothetical protein